MFCINGKITARYLFLSYRTVKMTKERQAQCINSNMDVLEGLWRSSKGQLRYNGCWRSTRQQLEQCSPSPKIAGEYLTVIQGLGANDRVCKDRRLENCQDEKKVSRKVEQRKNFMNALTAHGPEYSDSTHVSIHSYEKEKEQEAQQRVQDRISRFERHSEHLMQEKKITLLAKREERQNKLLEGIQDLQLELRNKQVEILKSQKDLEISHKKSAIRASEKVRHVEELKQKLIEEERNKREISSLHSCCEQVQGIYKELVATVKNCQYKDHLPSNIVTVTEEAKKVLSLSINTYSDSKALGKAVDGALQHLPEYLDMMKTLLSKAKAAASEAESKAKKEQAEKEAKQKEEEEKRKKEQEKKEQEKAKLQGSTAKGGAVPQHLSNCISTTSFKEYTKLENVLEKTEKSFEELSTSQDKSVKKLKLDLQRAVTTPINTISDRSPVHLMEKITKLSNLLRGQQIDLSGKPFSTSVHPCAPAYCSNLVAKKIVQQGSQQVSSNHNAAFPIATVAIGIWSAFPNVGELILAHFYKQCPFLVPLYIPQAEGMSDADYFQSLGYVCQDGEIEPRDKYLKRISGTIRLYAAIVSSMPPKGASPNHPHGIAHGWMWLSRILNLPPKPDYTATAIFEFLDVAGHALLKQYRNQFWKLILVLISELLPKIEQITAPSQTGPVARLKGFLEKAYRSRAMKVPEGYLSADWWFSSGVSGIYGT